jgi:hypothetical protein
MGLLNGKETENLKKVEERIGRNDVTAIRSEIEGYVVENSIQSL